MTKPMKLFNPMVRSGSELFAAPMSGEHAIRGRTKRDLEDKVLAAILTVQDAPMKHSAQLSGSLHRLRVYQLVDKISRTRRWWMITFGRAMSTALSLRRRDSLSVYFDAA